MRKLRAGIRKEFLLLINDKVGLSMMFFLPIFLVIIITSIQNSVFQLVEENKIDILVTDLDQADYSEQFIAQLTESKMIFIKEKLDSEESLMSAVNGNIAPFGIIIEKGFSELLSDYTAEKVALVESAMGLTTPEGSKIASPLEKVKIIYHPSIPINYLTSFEKLTASIYIKQKTNLLLSDISKQLGISGEFDFSEDLNDQKIDVVRSTFNGSEQTIPNASQHNVPAWSIFAVFFMVVSLAGNLVREKNNGSFDRIQTMPSSIWYFISSKSIAFFIVSFLQVMVIFSIGHLLFPFLDLPPLKIPSHLISFFIVVGLVGFTAVNYSITLGMYAKTQEQANGFGALSVVIFAAIGGIWVPGFVMPDLVKFFGNLSPLKWSLDLFYGVTIQNAGILELYIPISVIFLLNILFLGLILIKVRKLKLN